MKDSSSEYARGMHEAAKIAHSMQCELMGGLTQRPDSLSDVAAQIVQRINAANPGRGFGE